MKSFPSANFGLAPMEGVSDLPFRLWMSLTSAPSFAGTPFLRVTPTYPKARIPRAFAPELDELRDVTSYSLTPQLMASSPADFLRVAERVLEHSPFVDLNCGCPSPNAVGSMAGSSLLKNPQTFADFVEHISRELGPGRLSVKMRTGFESHKEFRDLLQAIEGLPLHHVTIHGRTRAQRYDGLSRWQMIAEASRSLPYPVIPSGDITSASSVIDAGPYLDRIDSLIIARGALRNPWLFNELRSQSLQTVTAEVLVGSLAVLGSLYILSLRHEDLLFAAAKEGIFTNSCGTNGEAWRSVFERLQGFLGTSQAWETLELPHFVMGRVKMIWNYLRSSLPDPFFAPQILRSRSFETLACGIQEAAKTCTSHNATLKHQEHLDWIYTSKKKPPRESDPLFH
ncbi:tRNA-dihydrouridine synthase family protein [Pseudobacteriovorax antillogorgiicola]|uniref:tRNA-dihydrouridine synthase family protein n=1 Tax=Pseudobacteriovorax antillogorgiicola TaxID=1513793 RepID=UPI001356478F|nr:tRNA-dihydrouridine synthase family protein [Pseudobacteriovorax antillogorgiicola]